MADRWSPYWLKQHRRSKAALVMDLWIATHAVGGAFLVGIGVGLLTGWWLWG